MSSLRDMGQDLVAPDTLSYEIVIRAWMNSSHPTRAQRASWLLSKLWGDYRLFGDERLRPKTSTYNLVICAASNVGRPDLSEHLLSELIELMKTDSNCDLVPNSESFNILIRGWTTLAKNGSKQALLKAVHWLDMLQKLENSDIGRFVPTEGVYDEILSAAVPIASVHPEVLDTAVDTFDKLRRSYSPVQCRSYAELLRAGLAALSLPENDHVRDAFVKELIKECAEAGLVGRRVVRALSNDQVFYSGWTLEESARLTTEFFPKWPLPASWTRNLKEQQFPREYDFKRTNFWRVNPHRHGPNVVGREI